MRALKQLGLWIGSGLCLIVGMPVCAQPVPSGAPHEAQPYSLERSAVLNVGTPGGEDYLVMVAWPNGDPPSSGWPVLYVLDGEDNFATVALAARRFARAGERSGIAPGIVVGIGAGPLARRVRDYTPPTPGYRIPAGRPAAGLETGSSEAFLDVLESRIMPRVRQDWRVDQTRETLAGHSFGGLVAIHALLTRPAMFDRVVAVSPSFWFGEGLLAREAAGASDAPRGSLAIMNGGLEEDADSASEAFATAFVKALPNARISRHVLPGQSHGGTMLAALPQTIAIAFGTESR